jgi:flavin-binding protein dodecin
MSVAKVTEITAASPVSFEEAVNNGLDRANETLDQIEGAWIKDMKVLVKKGKVAEYRVNMKLTFVLN